MSALRVGALIAAAAAGPPLYALWESGSLPATAALERGGLVAVACAAGAAGVSRIIDGYRRQITATARRDRAIAMIEELEALGSASAAAVDPTMPGSGPGGRAAPA